MRRFDILMLIFLLLVSTVTCMVGVNASIDNIGSAKQYSCVILPQICNCSFNNITTIIYPDKTFVYINSAMTKQGTSFNYTFCNTTQLGRYYINGIGDKDGVVQTFNYWLDITATGKGLDTSQSITYTIVFIISLIVFAGLIILGLYLPSSNKRDDMTGYILAVENLKYFKIFCFIFAYVVGLLIAFFAYSICYSYLDLPFLTSVTYFLFYGLAAGCFIFFPLMIYFMITNWIRDSKLADLLSRGLHVR